MIVKLWPIKASYGKQPGKTGGMQGLKNSIEYIADPEKTGSRDLSSIQVTDMNKGSYINRAKDIQQVIRYMANEDKIESTYISGYRCNPRLAAQEFERVVAYYGKQPKGNIAYHLVQSFPEDLDISDEEVHQCGLELCQRLGLYQAVVCSHVHPVLDEKKVLHGRCKHNHILFSAYPHPSLRDPNAKGPLKYHDCKATYRQLQIWNDEIAIEHGLPIIRTPDMQRTYSWSEVDAIQKGVSWKERIRLDIEEARRVTSNWSEFLSELSGKGYRIRDGKQVTYIAPGENKRVRGSNLGQTYTKESLERYWKMREEMLDNLEHELKSNDAPSLSELIRKGAKTVCVPLGTQGIAGRDVYHLSLKRGNIMPEALNTYFEPQCYYDVCDAQGNMIAAVPGKEITAYYLDKDTDQERNRRAAEENEHAIQEEETRRKAHKQEKQKQPDVYVNPHFRSSKTNTAYKVNFYDRNGRRISSLEAMFVLAMVVLTKEDGLWIPSTIPPDKMNEACYATTNWKLQNMMDSITTAREEGIDTPAEVERRLDNTGAAYSRASAALRRNTHIKEKMEDLKNAVVAYEKTRAGAEKIFEMPDGPEKDEQMKAQYVMLNQYKEAKAVMYAFGLKEETLEAQIIDFKRRWRHVESNLREATRQYDETRENYRKLKKLQYNMALAQNTRYCYGPEYETEPEKVHQSTGQEKGGVQTGKTQTESKTLQ